MAEYWDFESAEAFATGAIGQPGERTFYLQIRADGRTLSVKCEKTQVAELSRHMRGMLSDLPDVGSADSASAWLTSPVEQDFVLGSIGLGIDRASSRMVIQLEEMQIFDEDDLDLDDETDDADIAAALESLLEDDENELSSTVVRVLLTAAQAKAFCDVADSVVMAGREPCRWCGAPKEPSGHACPRMN
ncbi:MAG: hypothetical protein RLY50_509 [Actinomycetota bacterium]|jgi:uncharacterized repeat protein (TIGR03847 family)